MEFILWILDIFYNKRIRPEICVYALIVQRQLHNNDDDDDNNSNSHQDNDTFSLFSFLSLADNS